jgi:transmembrane sensor
MMNYRKYKATDFATDPYFRLWAIEQDQDAAIFWVDWLNDNPDKKEEVDEARAFLYVLAEKPDQTNDAEIRGRVEATLRMIQEGQEHIGTLPTRKLWYMSYARIAAMITLALGLGWFVSQYRQGGLPGQKLVASRYYAESGIVHYNDTSKPVTIVLEDGSTVILQPESELEYPKTFAKAKREVHLKGEAFFEITRNPNRPFLVLTDELVTQVLGTSFTVRSFEKDRNASVSVKTGRVSVYSKLEEQSAKESLSKEIKGVVLKPNQQVLFDKEESRLVKVIVNSPQRISDIPVTALVFDEIPVKNVFRTLETEYGIEIIFNEEALSACLLTANLSGLPMYEQLDLICKIIKARYEMIDGQVVIYSDGCK